jgi:hypothetical protein
VIERVSKAIAAAVGAGIAAVGQATINDPPGVTAEEWGVAVGAIVGAFLLTYWAPRNKV